MYFDKPSATCGIWSFLTCKEKHTPTMCSHILLILYISFVFKNQSSCSVHNQKKWQNFFDNFLHTLSILLLLWLFYVLLRDPRTVLFFIPIVTEGSRSFALRNISLHKKSSVQKLHSPLYDFFGGGRCTFQAIQSF